MVKILIVSMLFLGCSQSVSNIDTIPKLNLKWCLDIMVRYHGEGRYSMACFEEAPLCSKYKNLIYQYGKYAAMVGVSECYESKLNR